MVPEAGLGEALAVRSRTGRQTGDFGSLTYRNPFYDNLAAVKSALAGATVTIVGTPRGVAAGRKADQTSWWLKPGDIVEAEVEKVGCLRNRIVPELTTEPLPRH